MPLMKVAPARTRATICGALTMCQWSCWCRAERSDLGIMRARELPPGTRVVGHERYARAREHDELAARSPRLGRPEATRAALIPIRKSEAWWALPQDQRRAIFEERSRHIATGLKYLPAVARRLHHSRDLGEPFDFLTWFEFAPADEAGFDELAAILRATDEWAFVEREVDIRLER